MNNIIKENWEIIEEKVIKPMYEDGSFSLTVADEVAKALEKQIPKKPIKKEKQYSEDYGFNSDILCPVCNNYIGYYTEAMWQCNHALSGKTNELGEVLLHCEITDSFENVSLGQCIGNCESQESEVKDE